MNSDVTLMNSLFLRWERDNTPIAAFPGKYEWAGDRTQGDCSLRILNANFDYDNGGWVCQVFARYIFECLVKTVASAPQTKKPYDCILPGYCLQLQRERHIDFPSSQLGGQR